MKANAFTGNSDGITVNHTCLAAHIGLGVGSNEREKKNEQRSHAIDHVDHVRKAAEQGDAGAQGFLGLKYEHGMGVTQDYAEAVKWYRKAADQGYAAAQYNLALTYDEGKGVTQDSVEAHMWFNLAAARGNYHAAKSRDLVAKRMAPAQIAEAQRRAAKWRPRR